MRTQRTAASRPGVTLIFNDQDLQVGRIFHHARNDFSLHLNGWYWAGGQANQRGGCSGQTFKTLQAATRMAEAILQLPQACEELHQPPVNGTLDDLIGKLQALRKTVPGDMLVAFRSGAGGGNLNAIPTIVPERIKVKPHHGRFFAESSLHTGYGSKKAFTEPYQSQIEARPSLDAVLLW